MSDFVKNLIKDLIKDKADISYVDEEIKLLREVIDNLEDRIKVLGNLIVCIRDDTKEDE